MGPLTSSLASCEALRRSRCEKSETYADITGRYLLMRMAADERVVGISAATPYIMGFT